ncbi:MAG: hypothetical protein CR982_06805 [Candidatus Cloacimonadota bacterium]|nr:MAG: hypothetical protein CR982_06805 [Candidatus Cloacimonadota bacterium]PIE77807.1 MAG: hypothetical protein CSA15_10960 [Candidatus Delongbacteria bacterium]
MKEIKFPIHFFQKNRERFIKKLPQDSVTIVCSGINHTRSRDTFFPFRQDSNFFYLTGIESENSILIIVKNGEKASTSLYRKVIPKEMEKWIGASISVEEIEKVSGISKNSIEDINRVDDFFRELFIDKNMSHLLMYNEPYTGEAVPTYTQTIVSGLRNRYPFISVSTFNSIISDLRDIKSKAEIKIIRKAIEITGTTLHQILKQIKNFKNEREIEAELIRGYIRYGGSGHGFAPIVASGKNGTILHYEDNSSKISTNNLVLIDTGAEYKNYSADISRTYPAKGKYSPKQKEIYNIVLSAHNEVLKAIKPGATYKELQEITKESLFRGLKDLKIIKTKDQLSNYYFHGVSHPMGLDVHDVDSGLGILRKGNVITVEPGVYIAEKGIGIRLENDILVTENGFENLSKNIALNPEEIEELINN